MPTPQSSSTAGDLEVLPTVQGGVVQVVAAVSHTRDAIIQHQAAVGYVAESGAAIHA